MNAHMRSLCIGGAVLAAGAMATPALAEDPYELAWVSQIDTGKSSRSESVAVDSLGNAYISGWTDTNFDYNDALLSKFDAAGNHLWSQQIGTSGSDHSYSVAVDGLGNAYITGDTRGSLAGPNAGNADTFLSKFDAAGNHLWSRQVGTLYNDRGKSVAVDAFGNAYITGTTRGSLAGPSANLGADDAFLFKFDTDGNQVWAQQIGTDYNDRSWSVAVDSLGNAWITGATLSGSLGGPSAGHYDAFLSMFDVAGHHLWSRQIGTSSPDFSYSVAVDGLGNAYMTGYSSGDLAGPHAGGTYDAFLSKFDVAGNHLWSQQIGTSSDDVSHSVTVDALGNPWISGYTKGNLGGPHAGGTYDAFLSQFDTDGNHLWSQQIGTSSDDLSYSVAVDGLGNAWISGWTSGSLGGPNTGGSDAFVAKFSTTAPIPLPSAAWAGLALLGGIGGMKVLRRRGAAG